MAFFSFWLTNRSHFSTPGVFGGPITQVSASEVSIAAGNDQNMDNAVAALVAIPAARVSGADSPIQSIVDGGWNWGKLHPKNAVDIAAPCGRPIYSFAEGIVSKIGSPAKWNDGYGGFVEVKHKDPAGKFYYTRYNHTQENFAKIDNYVLQGQVLALVGRTGNVHGPTGCHVHFEVNGVKNPFVR